MKVFHGSPPPELSRPRPAVTVGLFDGVHLGHRAVLEATKRRAVSLGAPAVVLTFDRHPRAIVSPPDCPPMITSLEHRLDLFARLGIDAVLVCVFDRARSEQPAAAFAQEMLFGALGARAVVLGHDTHFGRDREGNAALLRRLAEGTDVTVDSVPPVVAGGVTVSSTAIRRLVRAGDLSAAAALLGRPVEAMGTVAHGKGLGRQLGFPTMNLNLHHELHPPQGVYLSRTRVGETEWPSATFIGSRSTADARGPEDVLVETHVLIGPVGDLYGQTAVVSFERLLRPVRSFPDLASLTAAIARDVAAAKAHFGIE